MREFTERDLQTEMERIYTQWFRGLVDNAVAAMPMRPPRSRPRLVVDNTRKEIPC